MAALAATACRGASSTSSSTSPSASASATTSISAADVEATEAYSQAYKPLDEFYNLRKVLTLAEVRSDCQLLSKAYAHGVPFVHNTATLQYDGSTLHIVTGTLLGVARCPLFPKPEVPSTDAYLAGELEYADDALRDIELYVQGSPTT